MTDIVISAMPEPSNNFPLSTSIASQHSNRRDTLRHSDQMAEPPGAESPPMRLTRKRAASLNTEAANQRFEQLGLNSAKYSNQPPRTAREQICLCQPDPKIPRPRNAFILYRQHYQAQVVAQHPGLANPEISKIIGEQWRDQPNEVKNDWKRLAEEEKQRHQRQYPDYRYQPRRAGKANSARPTNSNSLDDPVRCPKCGGRYISTPSTPLTPFVPALGALGNRSAPNTSMASPQAQHTPDRARFPNNMNTPRTLPTNQHLFPYAQHSRSHFGGPINSPMSTNLPRERDEEMDLVSPQKRRRFEEGARNYQAQQTPYGDPQRPQMSAFDYSNERAYSSRGPLPGPSQLMHGQHQHHHQMGGMEPPPRPPTMQPGTPHPFHSQSGFDESLRLPPLQTQLLGSAPIPNFHTYNDKPQAPLQRISSPHQQHSLLHRQNKEDELRSVEAMVMTIPYINKIKVLSKISPPLAAPGPMSPVPEVRGPVIAVEGADLKNLKAVGQWISEYLEKERECTLKTWVGGVEDESGVDVEMQGSDVKSPVSGDTFISYLAEIHDWHRKSNEIAKFITTPINTPKIVPVALANDDNPATAPLSPSTTASGKSPELPTAAAFEQNTKPTTAEASMEIQSTAPAPAPTSITGPVASIPAGLLPALPVALLPSGFSLTTSDLYSSRIPINDAYAPVDHWQWAATLWRGIIGPDLTIYVKGIAPLTGAATAATGGNGNVVDREEREEMVKSGGVEVRTDCKAIVVRSEVGADGVVEEKTLRRLGFEVLEFVRSFGTV